MISDNFYNLVTNRANIMKGIYAKITYMSG